ncbi:MAG TPA: di-heme oxidoredictase family protein [Isosphaeraceae bacterium]|jgi:CxxC motif-containing protein (DUF1111 family)|nr:di-heme oxidoredictase family protein [Isosphaeraceae bacterium]
MRARRQSVGIVASVSIGLGLLACAALQARAGAGAVEDAAVAEGRELFLRDWTPRDSRSRAGDGLGPVYNERSCVACHGQGAPGGAGPIEKNVDLITASWTHRDAMAKLHPGLVSARSVVLHRFGTGPDYDAWRLGLLGPAEAGNDLSDLATTKRHEDITLFRTQRNAPALFGLGRIDAVPDAVLEEAAARELPTFPEVHGRVCRLPGGGLGRFGWKAQVGTLDDFVRSACAGELGLEVPGHSQGTDPRGDDAPPTGLDLSQGDCDALAAYIRSLPAPVALAPKDDRSEIWIEQGARLFVGIGCATCHTPRLGDVDGLFSDLLLHDMGRGLTDAGTYYGVPVDAPPSRSRGELVRGRQTRNDGPLGARASEWRTPPLWGYRDTGPYLHDGRAETLDQAVDFHGGEAAATARRFGRLSRSERKSIVLFLSTLVAPPDLVAAARRPIGVARPAPFTGRPHAPGRSPRHGPPADVRKNVSFIE